MGTILLVVLVLLLLGVLPTLLFMGILIYGMRQYSSGSGVMAGSASRPRAGWTRARSTV